MDQLRFLVPDNWHCHWRQNELMTWMVKMLVQSGFRGRVLGMPNTNPPVLTGEDAMRYFQDVCGEMERAGGNFTPVITIQITEQTTPAMIKSAYKRSVQGAKVYPRYVTTNSENGVVDYTKIYPALAEAEKLGMIVCFHPEHPSYKVEGLNKESAFIAILEEIRDNFPKLKIVVEHVTTGAMVCWVKDQPVGLVGATITSHHPFITMDDVLGYSKASGGRMNVHNGCKPQAKWLADRDCLQRAILSGDPHFFYGGDDAAHLVGNKHLGACGVFNTPVALSLLTDLAVRYSKLEQLQKFLSVHGANFYDYPIADENITLVNEEWQVPEIYEVPGTGSGVVPFMAGTTMQWKIER